MDTTTKDTLTDAVIPLGLSGYVQSVFLILLSVIVIAGNVLTITAVYKNPYLRTVPNLYVVSLSCADILAGVSMSYVGLTLTPDLVDFFVNEEFLCMLKYTLVYISLCATASNLSSVAIDRYIYILHPMKYVTVVTFNKAFVVIATSWTVAIVLGTVPMYVNTWARGIPCYAFHVMYIWYQVPMSIFLFGASTGIILFCYGRIIYVARQQMKKIRSTCPSIQVNNLVGPSQVKKDWKLIKMFILVFGVFFVCWAPSVVGIFLAINGGTSDNYMGYSVMLGTVNSGMNVFIYAFKNEGFRRAFKKILYRKWIRTVLKMCGRNLGDRPSGECGLSSSENNTTVTHIRIESP